MPELPEVEHLRRTLAPHLLRRTIVAARLRRRDVLRHADPGPPAGRRLLAGARLDRLLRHGKQLAVVACDGRALCIHLGMSGSLLLLSRSQRPPAHTHAVWTLDDGRRLCFTDPRRFGGLWAYASLESLRAHRWAGLGVDALRLRPEHLRAAALRTRRPLKSLLMDQGVIAGIGNIYADEACFTACVDPRRPARTLRAAECARVVSALRSTLRAAIAHGGSTVRTYADAQGRPGAFQGLHRVYGRGGQPCPRCSLTLATVRVAQRTTVLCPRCQR